MTYQESVLPTEQPAGRRLDPSLRPLPDDKNEPDDCTPDGITPPTAEERERNKSYAQLARERELTEDDRKAEEARIIAQPKISGGRLSVGLQPQPIPKLGPSAQHFEETVWLPKFSVDDARKLKGGEGQQFRVDAVKMVEAETARVAQLHEMVGVSDVWLGCDGLPTDPANDFTSLDAALAAAQAQVEVRDDGDSDVKEIAIISACLAETARYWAIEGAEQEVPLEDPNVLGRRADESEESFQRRGEAWRQYQLQKAQREAQYQAQPGDDPLNAPQWKTGD